MQDHHPTPSGEIILLKYGEIALKGLNRRSFESTLMANLRHRLRRVGRYQCVAQQSTVTVRALEEPEQGPFGGPSAIDLALDECLRVFGFVSVTRAAACPKQLEAVNATAADYLADTLRAAGSFKVESKRADKRFPQTSPELSREVGHHLLECFPHLRVDLHHPEVEVRVEIREDAAYVHAGAQPGAGGIPVSCSGRGTLLLSGGIDSPVAGYLMARRGLRIDAVHFHSHPYTSERARQKVEDLARLLSRWVGDVDFYVVPFTRVQEQLRDSCDAELFTILTRRFMMRISERLAGQAGSGALITGESLGQVASQTLDGITVTNQSLERLPALRPLIGQDKDDIVRLARRIGTFEKSIEPYEDCCAIFSPKHPRINPKLEKVLKEEDKLDIEELVEDAVARVEKVLIRYGKEG